MEKKRVIAVSGIDTDIGKTVATGAIARSLLKQGYNVFTQKMVQTGCTDISEDITVHRQFMRIELTGDDKTGISCPYIFPVPCSPHLAARLVGEKVDPAKIAAASDKLLQQYDILLLEGAGGLSVPLTLDYTFIDYLEEYCLPVVLVSSPRLGSLNHTINALEILRARQIQLAGIVYNLHGYIAGEENKNEISAMVADSRETMLYYLQKYNYMNAGIIDLYSPPQSDSVFHREVERLLLRTGV